ncbi:MAG: capsular biosynthesis protein [Bacteroidetes bacterium]|nr:capsular biosynthesis protein [Bacteroidota bacterium]
MSLFSGMFGGKSHQLKNALSLRDIEVDMHSHFIPGLDDGSKSIEESVEIIKQLAVLGYRKLITTPHIQVDYYRNSAENILPGLDTLRLAVKDVGIHIGIEAAAEYLMDDGFEDKIKTDDFLTFGSKHILVEFSYFSIHPAYKEYFFELQVNGYKIILAHPERYSFWHNDIGKFEDLKNRGIFFQMNVGSITGYYSPEVKKFAEKLIDADMIDFIGSDIHNQKLMDELVKSRYDRLMEKLLNKGKLLNNTL